MIIMWLYDENFKHEFWFHVSSRYHPILYMENVNLLFLSLSLKKRDGTTSMALSFFGYYILLCCSALHEEHIYKLEASWIRWQQPACCQGTFSKYCAVRFHLFWEVEGHCRLWWPPGWHQQVRATYYSLQSISANIDQYWTQLIESTMLPKFYHCIHKIPMTVRLNTYIPVYIMIFHSINTWCGT